MLLEVDGTRVLTDPVVGARVGMLVRRAASVSPSLLEGVDAVLLSHLHADHTDLPSLRRIAAPLVVAPRGAGGWLAGRLGGEVREIGVGEEARVGALRIEATHAAHDPRRWPIGGVRADPLGFVIRGSRGGSSAYFAGDTDLFDGMTGLAGSIDVALLPVAGWGATLGPGHLDPARAAEAAARIGPRVAVPIHWGTLAPRWPLKPHPDPGAPPREFARFARTTEVRVLQPGQRTEIA